METIHIHRRGNELTKNISQKTRLALWTRAAGRCQYAGCNKFLLGDIISGEEKLNKSYVAHIVARESEGPRGDPVRSPQLADNIENVMLLCDAHHRLIDKEAVVDHPEARLLAMKRTHESRIASVTDIQNDMGTHVLLYGARIGEHDCPVRFDLAKQAVLPNRYPLETQGIQLNMVGCSFKDDEQQYWDIQVKNLNLQFQGEIQNRIYRGVIGHVSIFALAPQPLLIVLGRLLSDIPAAEVFQLHREPQTWGWQNDGPQIEFTTSQPESSSGKIVVLKLALSAAVTDARIHEVLGSGVPIWSIAAAEPHNDILRYRDDLSKFRMLVRQTFDRIKAQHGETSEIHLFPVLPVSAAVEVGRVWMPKADLPLVIYDQIRSHGGFANRIRIDANNMKEYI